MIRWVPFDLIGRRQLEGIAASLLIAPEEVRLENKHVIEGLATGMYRLFDWDGGLFIVHKDDNRLVIDAMQASIWKRKDLAKELKELATHWLCDTVVTTVFDRRLADAIVKIGGEIESFDVTLPVGNDHEQ